MKAIKDTWTVLSIAGVLLMFSEKPLTMLGLTAFLIVMYGLIHHSAPKEEGAE